MSVGDGSLTVTGALRPSIAATLRTVCESGSSGVAKSLCWIAGVGATIVLEISCFDTTWISLESLESNVPCVYWKTGESLRGRGFISSGIIGFKFFRL